MLRLAQFGYVTVIQDCRGTGDSEPDSWDLFVFEREDSYDLVEWITSQAWYDGFIGGAGGSYEGGTQWCMSLHPKMSAVAPEVAAVGGVYRGVHWHMFMNAYALSVGKGAHKLTVSYEELEHQMLRQTLLSGFFRAPMSAAMSDPLLAEFPELNAMAEDSSAEWLWEQYCSSPPAERSRILKLAMQEDQVTLDNLERLPTIFGRRHPDEHIMPFETVGDQYHSLNSPALMISGWYDWGLDATLQTWDRISKYSQPAVRDYSRLFIPPSAHAATGYHEGADAHPELNKVFRGIENLGLLLAWYDTARKGAQAFLMWPRVIYYLMGAGQWRPASDWPPANVRFEAWYLASGGRLSASLPTASEPDSYTYDPNDPTPTVGGSFVSSVYVPGSADVSEVQARLDVVAYTTDILDRDIDVVGPLRFVLYASSSAQDTDFVIRLSDVFPDGRAIGIQNGIIRARYREPDRPSLLEPERAYKFEVDMWSTANRFLAGHRIRIDISSSDFPRFDRNTNLGGSDGNPISARQRIFHDVERPSHIDLPIVAS